MSKSFEYAGGYNAHFVTGGAKGKWGEYVVVGGLNGEVRGEKLLFHGEGVKECRGPHRWLDMDIVCVVTYVFALVGVVLGMNASCMSYLVCCFRLAFALVVLNRWKYGYAVAFATVALSVCGDESIAEQELLLCSGASFVWLFSRLVFVVFRWLFSSDMHWANATGVALMLMRVMVGGGRAMRAGFAWSLFAAIACDLAVVWYVARRVRCVYVAESTIFLLLMATFVPLNVAGLVVPIMICEMISFWEIVAGIDYVIRRHWSRTSDFPVVLDDVGYSDGISNCDGADGEDDIVRMLLEGKYGNVRCVSLEEWDSVGLESSGVPSSEVIRSYALSGDKVMSYALEVHCYVRNMRPGEVNSMKQLILSNGAMARFFDERMAELFENVAGRSAHRKATLIEALVGVSVAEGQLWYDDKVRRVVLDIANENMIDNFLKVVPALLPDQVDSSFTVSKICQIMEFPGRGGVDQEFVRRLCEGNVVFDRKGIKALARVGRAALEASWTCAQVAECQVVGQITVAIGRFMVEAYLSDAYYYIMSNSGGIGHDVGRKAAAENFLACIGILAIQGQYNMVCVLQKWFMEEFVVASKF